MAYLGNTPSTITKTDFRYTAAAGQTLFSGPDESGIVLFTTTIHTDVFRNGILISPSNYTITGSSVTFNTGVNLNDIITIRAFGITNVLDAVSATTGGTFGGNVVVNGDVTATSFTGDGANLTNLPVSLSSLGIDNHDTVTVDASGNVTATSFAGDGSSLTNLPVPSLTSLGIDNHDTVTVDASGNVTATSFTGDGSNLTGISTLTEDDATALAIALG